MATQMVKPRYVKLPSPDAQLRTLVRLCRNTEYHVARATLNGGMCELVFLDYVSLDSFYDTFRGFFMRHLPWDNWQATIAFSPVLSMSHSLELISSEELQLHDMECKLAIPVNDLRSLLKRAKDLAPAPKRKKARKVA